MKQHQNTPNPMISFPIPEGMVPPEGTKDGSTFDALATVRLDGDTLTIVAVDGIPVEAAEAPETEDEGGDFMAAVMDDLDTSGMEE
jgi:hypothetical protein